jgi:hypothetical protein
VWFSGNWRPETLVHIYQTTHSITSRNTVSLILCGLIFEDESRTERCRWQFVLCCWSSFPVSCWGVRIVRSITLLQSALYRRSVLRSEVVFLVTKLVFLTARLWICFPPLLERNFLDGADGNLFSLLFEWNFLDGTDVNLFSLCHFLDGADVNVFSLLEWIYSWRKLEFVFPVIRVKFSRWRRREFVFPVVRVTFSRWRRREFVFPVRVNI